MTDLLIAAALAAQKALDADRTAQAADQGHDLPSTAANHEAEAMVALTEVAEEFLRKAREYQRRSFRHRQVRDQDPMGVA